MELTEKAEFDEARIKDVAGLVEGSITVQSQLIWLAWWMKERYGSTMNQALKTVLPVKQTVRQSVKRTIRCLLDQKELEAALCEAQTKGFKARCRLLAALKEQGSLPYGQAVKALKLTPSTLTPLKEAGIIAVE